jgi:flagellar biogenesis protein FliO
LSALLLPASLARAAPDSTPSKIAAPNGAVHDDAVQRATYQTAAASTLAAAPVQKSNEPMPSEPMPIGPAGRDSSDPGAAHAGRRDASSTASSAPAVLSMFGSLAVVIGLFLGLVWLLRRGAPKAARLLPAGVVEVLGRSPLAGRQQMHVIRFGTRLLLVTVSPDGAETLAEITEPAEVDRLAGLCQQTQPNSATQAFRQIFGQLADVRRGSQLETATSAVASPPIGSRESASRRHAEDDDV